VNSAVHSPVMVECAVLDESRMWDGRTTARCCSRPRMKAYSASSIYLNRGASRNAGAHEGTIIKSQDEGLLSWSRV